MMRTHQIARMFMCRCCNWAFPDKTSLHLHTTSLSKTGKPGEVAVLARSFAEGDEPLTSMDLHNTPSSSPPDTRDSISPSDSKPSFDPPTMGNIPSVQMPHPLLSNPVYLQAFLGQMEMMKRNQERTAAERSEEIFPFRKNPWLENNAFLNVPKEQQTLLLAALYKEVQNRKRQMSPEEEPKPKKANTSNEYPSLAKFNIGGDSDGAADESLNTSTKSESNERKNKRKSRKPQQLPQSDLLGLSGLDIFNGPLIKTEFEEKKNGESDGEQNQLSPAVSDSHTSGSGHETHEASEPPKKEDEKANDYAERLVAISKSISKFIELAQKDNLEQEKQLVLDIAFEIKDQCLDV